MIRGNYVDAVVPVTGFALTAPTATVLPNKDLGLGISVTKGDVPGYPGRTILVCCACPVGGMMALLTVDEAVAMASALIAVADQRGEFVVGDALQ